MKWRSILFVGVILLLVLGGCEMPHGSPPWSGIKKETVYSLSVDMGELAARLGSPDRYDRRGDVVFIDSFENGLAPYRTYAFLANSSVVLSALTSRSGAYSCKLTASGAPGGYALVSRYQPYPVLSKHGLEYSFTLDDLAGYIQIYLNLYDGSHLTYFKVRYVPGSDSWQYYNSAGVWTDLATGVVLAADYQFFHTAKLVADFKTDTYVSFLWDDTPVDMSGIAGCQIASPTNAVLEAAARIDGSDAGNSTIYVDDFIITQNE